MIEDFSPFWISLKTALVATFLTFISAIPVAWFTTKYFKKANSIIDSILTLPLILPPTVVGFILLIALGKNSFIGSLLAKWEINIIFSWSATVIAAFVVSFPLMYKTTKSAFEQINPDLLDVAKLLGANEFQTLTKIIIPLSWPGIIAGTVLAFARSLGEFGATLMIAGNIPGQTQTIPLAIFFASEGGEMHKAYLWVSFIFLFSFIIMFFLNFWLKHQTK